MQVDITAILKDPAGVWKDKADVGCPDGTPPNAVIVQILATLRSNGGLITFTDKGTTAEYIPMERVQNIMLSAREIVVLNGGGEAAIKQASAQAAAAAANTKRLHV